MPYAPSECRICRDKIKNLIRSSTQDLAIVDVAFRAYGVRRAVRLWGTLIGEHEKR